MQHVKAVGMTATDGGIKITPRASIETGNYNTNSKR